MTISNISVLLTAVVVTSLIAFSMAYAEPATIKVKSAAWGMGIDIDVTPDVAKLCNGEKSCKFSVDPANFGGKTPPNQIAHKLRVSYSCGGNVDHKEAMDFQEISLSCD